jgi:uncharacterized membrane protein
VRPTYRAAVLALDYDTARNVAILLVAVFVVLSVVSAIIIKNVTTKIISIVVMVGLALGVWTQRSSLKDCADRAKERVEVGATSGLTCTFFGTDVEVLDGDDAE